ncbi:MAG: hypothetical protein AAFO07_29005, partial [Bacteroidota bacterium]
KALELDPKFDLAHAWLAWIYCSLAGSWGDLKADSVYQDVQKELAFIADHSELEGMYYKVQGWMSFWLLDRASAEQYIRKAVDIDPDVEFGIASLGMFLTLRRNFQEGQKIAKQALDRNPHFFWNYFVVAQSYYYNKQFTEAREAIESSQALFENHQASIGMKSKLLSLNGKYEEALIFLENAMTRLNYRPANLISDIGITLAMKGETEQAKQIAEDLIDRLNQGEKNCAYYIAKIYGQLELENETLLYLEKAVEYKDDELNWMEVDLEFEFLRSDERFQQLVQN